MSTLPATYSSEWVSGFPLGQVLAGDGKCHCVTSFQLGGLAGWAQDAGWSVDLGIPPSVKPERITLLREGFRILLAGGGEILLICQGPGFFVGAAPSFCVPELFSPLSSPRVDGAVSYLERGAQSIGLVSETAGDTRRFALWVGAPGEAEARQRLIEALGPEGPDLATQWRSAEEKRARWLKVLHLEESASPGLCLERLVGLIAPAPSGEGLWLADENGLLPVAHVLAILPILGAIAPRETEEVLLTLGRMPTTPAGWMPVAFGDSRPAWPVIAQYLKRLPAALREGAAAKSVLERAGQHLDAHLQRKSGRMLPEWPDPEVALTPEVLDSEILHADLAALLVVEMESWEELAGHPGRFSAAAAELRDRLLKEFWSPAHNALADRPVSGGFAKRLTVASLLPLLWKDLPADKRGALWRRVTAPNGLRGPQGLRQWEVRSGDPVEPPVRPDVQSIFLPLLSGAPADAAILLAESWGGWGAASGTLPSPLAAALYLRVLPHRDPTGLELGKYPAWIRFLERNHRVILMAAAAVLLLIPSIIGLRFTLRSTLSKLQQASLSGHAETLLTLRRFADAEEIYTRLIQQSRPSPATPRYHYFRGNARFRQGRLEDALADYETAVRLDPEGELVPARWNLAQTLARLGRTQEASEWFQRIATEYGDEIPGLRARAQNAIHLLASP